MKKNIHALLVGSIDFDLVSRPIGLFRLRTAAEDQGFDVEVIDYSWCIEENEMLAICDHCIGDNTLVFGISGVWWSFLGMNAGLKKHLWACESFFNIFKKKYPHVKIVLGAPPTGMNIPQVLKDNCDWVFSGFSDQSFPELLKKLSGQQSTLKYFKEEKHYVVKSNRDHVVQNMSTIQTKWKENDGWLSNQPIPLELSRGCIFKCAFCNHPFLGKKSFDYIRSEESIADELSRNYELFGTTRYLLLDDTMNDSLEKLDRLDRAIELSKIPNFEFCAYIKPETIVTNPSMIQKLKHLGLRGGFVGIESFNMTARKSIGKGMDINKVNDVCAKLVSQSNAKLFCSLILGLPGDKLEDADKWLDFLKANRKNLYSCWNMHPLGIMGEVGEDGTSLIEKNPEKFGYTLLSFDSLYNTWHWKNKNMSSMAAGLKAENFRQKSSGYLTAGGWIVGSHWYIGSSDETIDNENFSLKELAKTTATISNNRKKQILQSLNYFAK